MLLSTTEGEVLTAAETLGEALTEAQSDLADAEFERILEECNEAISETTGIEYGEVCETSSGCC